MTTPDFTLTYDPATGAVTTTFHEDGSSSRVLPNEWDEYYGNLLGITAGEHKLLHELCHHHIAIAKGLKYCPIIWAQAHLQPMPEGAKDMEMEILSWSFFVMNKIDDPHYDRSRIFQLYKTGDIYEINENILFDFHNAKIQP